MTNNFGDVAREKREDAFNAIYDSGYWGTPNASGAGSTLEATATTRGIVSKVIVDYEITSVVDVACGDFTWMPLVLQAVGSDVRYTGCDIVGRLVKQHTDNYPQYTFKHLDFVAEDVPPADLIVCRDVLQHLPVEDIQKALDRFSRSGASYLLATTHLRRYGWRNGANIRPGRCRDRNLLLAPFNLPDPSVIYSEKYPAQHKFLGLWELPFSTLLT
jgi:2-polyprenyl-3-methyl-5-hydroxy-6-metoxy-1,4-benzoquinol methylase